MRQSKTILSICSGSYWKGQNEKEGGHFNLIFLIGEEKKPKKRNRYSNRPEPDLDKFYSCDNLNYQESINRQNFSLTRISCSYLIGVKDNSVTDITDSFMQCQ